MANGVGLAAGRPRVLRPIVWLLHLALPLLGLWLLLAQPDADVRWEDHSAHFWLVLAVAATNVLLAARVGEAARSRSDARLTLVALAFLTSAGFLGLHALATPGVILDTRTAGFTIATPVGLTIAAAFAAASALDLSPAAAAKVNQLRVPLIAAVAALMVTWAVVSLADLPPLQADVDEGEAGTGLALAGIPLFLLAAVGYARLYRRRPSVVLISVLTAFVLLAEALLAVAVARTWQLSWWEWHLLLLFAFGFVAYSAQVTESREGTRSGLFDSIALDQTLRDIRAEHRAALDALVDAMRRGEPARAAALRLAERFELTEGQADVLERGAEALAHEREQIDRLGVLVAIGHEASVIVEEELLLERALTAARRAFTGQDLRVRLGAHEPEPGRVSFPLAVKGRPAGSLDAVAPPGGLAERDLSLLESLASQLSIALENARLYRQLDDLFKSYMSADVATALLADPAQAALGGAIADVTVLFADLRGFTALSERTPPEEVVELLNRRFGAAVPAVLAQGGTVIEFVGDALVALFGAPVRHADHALRAARAALALQAAVGPEPPRFRVGLNSGPALIGNIGTEERRNYTAIGDTVNLASRLEAAAQPGQVVLGPATRAALGHSAHVQPLGPLAVKGKAEPVEAWVLTGLSAFP
jgi:class 3 adenylate cyclase